MENTTAFAESFTSLLCLIISADDNMKQWVRVN